MTNIGILKECPNCQEQLFKDGQKYCSNCGFDLKFKKENKDFATPDYYYYQSKDVLRSETKIKMEDDAKYTKYQDILKRLRVHMEHITGEDCIAATDDALLVFKTLPKRRHTTEEIRHIVSTGKQIGTIATSIETLYKAIGVFNAEQQGTSEFSDDDTSSN
jgi:uncharacterized Zn finger protein (UPF0148 family)